MITIIGGSNVDYIAKSSGKLVQFDSNPGCLSIKFGGVGRNITKNIALFNKENGNNKINFISCIGSDQFGNDIKKELDELNVNVINASKDKSSSSYIAILDNNGEMNISINSMDNINDINIELIKENDKLLKDSDYIVLDTNISIDVIDYVASNYKNVIIDCISVSKANKIINSFDKFYLVKANEYEYKSLYNNKFIKFPKYLLVTHGNKNVLLIKDGKEINEYNVIKKDNVVNVTGAGDALLATIVYLLDNNYKIEDTINYGIIASSYTLDSIESVNSDIGKLVRFK